MNVGLILPVRVASIFVIQVLCLGDHVSFYTISFNFLVDKPQRALVWRGFSLLPDTLACLQRLSKFHGLIFCNLTEASLGKPFGLLSYHSGTKEALGVGSLFVCYSL